jgi:membrane protein DedA with SNARE-associated domain
MRCGVALFGTKGAGPPDEPDMTDWVTSFVSSAGYFGIVLLMFAENVFPPIPSELIMPLAGYLAAQGNLSLVGVVLAGMLGSVLGALPLYYAGRLLGDKRLKSFADKHGRWLTFSGSDIARADKWFAKHGHKVIFTGRLVPGVRSLISIPAGIAKMNLASFLAYTALGSGLWAGLLASAGFFLGNNFSAVGRYIDVASAVVLTVVATVYIVRVVRYKQA